MPAFTRHVITISLVSSQMLRLGSPMMIILLLPLRAASIVEAHSDCNLQTGMVDLSVFTPSSAPLSSWYEKDVLALTHVSDPDQTEEVVSFLNERFQDRSYVLAEMHEKDVGDVAPPSQVRFVYDEKSIELLEAAVMMEAKGGVPPGIAGAVMMQDGNRFNVISVLLMTTWQIFSKNSCTVIKRLPRITTNIRPSCLRIT